mmetsp:Transcript_36542/g.54580  ORF Transcript_36542/g.54580 Transcript_36542/m.54580 type:complete len:272 (-) Transcript_36542:364-1179(-)
MTTSLPGPTIHDNTTQRTDCNASRLSLKWSSQKKSLVHNLPIEQSDITNIKVHLDIVDSKKKEKITAPPTNFFDDAAKNRSPSEIEQAWAKLKNKKNETYPNTILSDVKLNYTINDFYRIFWSSNTANPYEDYKREVQGHEDIITTSWIDSGDKFTLCRSQKYLHPNSAPVGPRMAKAVTQQTLQWYGDHGIQICFATTVEGTPMADCFVLKDRILVEATDDGLIMRVDMGICFVKKTIYKRIIAAASKAGSKKTWESFVDYIQKLPNYPK